MRYSYLMPWREALWVWVYDRHKELAQDEWDFYDQWHFSIFEKTRKLKGRAP